VRFLNALEIKEYLLENQDKLTELLEDIGLANIHYRTKEELRCSYAEGWNSTGVKIVLNENLSYTDYSNNDNGDIFKLVRNKLDYKEDEFYKSFKYICDFLDVKATVEKIEKPKIFGGLFTQFSKQKTNNLTYNIKTYPMDLLNDYDIMGNVLFQKDGIDLKTQIKYNIGYDWYTHRITIPEFSFEGELVGVTGRYNGQDYDENGEPKYYPIIEFPKSQVLFGYAQNYYDLCNSTVWLVESQKSVMRMDSLGKRTFLALGGRTLSPIQVKYIQNLNPKNIIVALDEGIEEEEMIKLCELLKPKTSFFTYKVGYVFDKNNEYLQKGSKDSPADLPLNKLKLLAKKVKWVYE
jgi:hypothetical protein